MPFSTPHRRFARRTLPALPAVCLAGLLVGCAQQEPLKLPATPSVSAFKEAAPPWTTAQPSDQAPRGDWWTLYGDAELDALQQRLIANSPDLAAALARYQQSPRDHRPDPRQPVADADRLAERPARPPVPAPPAARAGPDLARRLRIQHPGPGPRIRDRPLGPACAIRSPPASPPTKPRAAPDLASARLSLQAQLGRQLHRAARPGPRRRPAGRGGRGL